MSSVIHQYDKRSGITYAYESCAHWDKTKKRSVAKRTLIGRVDKDTGEIVATDGRNRKPPKDIRLSEPRCFYGATYLLDAIGEKTGIAADLKNCLPDTYLQLLSIAYYLILEDASPLFRFEKWNRLHHHPCGCDIPSQRSSELFASISEADRMKFFELQGRRSAETEYWCYDTTSISSYSQNLNQVRRGFNKEHDPFAQLNLALIFGEKSRLPLYYRKLAGNIPDVKTVRHLLDDLKNIGFATPKLVMDKGFFSQDNLNGLFKEHVKFIQAVRLSIAFVRKELDGIYDDFRSFEWYHADHALYARTIRTEFEYHCRRPYKGDELQEKRRLYIHFYYHPERAAEDETGFDRKLILLREELETDRRVQSHESLYAEYFEVTRTPKRGIRVAAKADAIKRAKKYFGYFALLSNEKMNAMEALNLYRNKDLIEKSFGNLKERLNFRRTLVSSEQSLNGKLFVQFIALIYLSYIKKQMEEHHLFKDYTIQGLLDELDMIECIHIPGKRLRIAEVLEKHKELYQAMEVPPPTSL